MIELIDVISMFTNIREDRFDEDIYDKCIASRLFIFFMASAIIVTATQYFGKPMSCAIPLSVPFIYSRYIDQVCYLSKIYFWPDEENLQDETSKRYDIHYLSYLPLISPYFLLAALFSLLPNMFWRNISDGSAVGISKIIEHFRMSEKKANYKMHTMTVENTAVQLYDHFHFNRKGIKSKLESKNILQESMKIKNNYLVKYYLFYKVLNIVSVLSSILILHILFERKFIQMGFEIFSRIKLGEWYGSSKIFPFFALCDLDLKTILNDSKYTFECVLTRSIFLDVLINCTWFILAISLCLSIYGLILAYYKYVMINFRLRTVFNLLYKYHLVYRPENVFYKKDCKICNVTDKLKEPCEDCKDFIAKKSFTFKQLNTFVSLRVSPDLFFVLMFIKNGTVFGEETISRIILKLWEAKGFKKPAQAQYELSSIKKEKNKTELVKEIEESGSEESIYFDSG